MNSNNLPARCLLIGVAFGGRPRGEDSLDELDALARSAELAPEARVIVRRARPDAALCIGSGKADEIGQQLESDGIEVVVFDHEISPIQQRNLNRLWKLPVLDRTELILDIFGRRARSHEGKLQVELARLQHLQARLVRGWTHLERQRGGIGVRGGPGEKQIELDRRMLGDRVRRLRGQLDQMKKQRRTRRRARDRRPAFAISLVGYTNAGKSTLFNRLTGAGTFAADQLFATLDTLTRRLRLPSGAEVVVSDTVGFVRELPHQLVEAFAATLEETAEADLLLHVVDASAADRDEQIAEVERVLGEIGAGDVPRLTVMNKIDRNGLQPRVAREACGSIDRLWVSAVSGAGIDALRQAIGEQVALWRARRLGAAPHAGPPQAESHFTDADVPDTDAPAAGHAGEGTQNAEPPDQAAGPPGTSLPSWRAA